MSEPAACQDSACQRRLDRAMAQAQHYRREAESLRAAGKKIIEADDEFRATLGPHWDGDPVSDACEAARGLFCGHQQTSPAKET